MPDPPRLPPNPRTVAQMNGWYARVVEWEHARQTTWYGQVRFPMQHRQYRLTEAGWVFDA